jgi:crotonobetainyl-CoA:carnitine CoA-transferase CaiB-like acyl-CoA transferase
MEGRSDMTSTSATGPLRGVRILDLTTMASGPWATSILGDQGADVIKIEAPGTGDLLRQIGRSRGGLSAVFNSLNRSKRSLVLDLQSDRGVAVFDRLVAGADVVVQNHRPGVAERLGVGPERLCARHPELVYVSISGFGETGPLAQRPVYDSVMQAYSGFAASQADPEDGTPRFVQNIVCDKGTALMASQAITAALFARARGDGGQHLRLSMLHASIAFLWPDVMQHLTYLDAAAASSSPGASRPTLPSIRRTADGFVTFTAIGNAEFGRLCAALGRPDLVDDPRFADAGPRADHAAELSEVVNPLVRAWPTAELAARLEAEQVPHAVVNALESLHEDVQVRATGVLEESLHPTAGRQRQPTPPARFEATPSAVSRPAPMLGEHSREVLGEIGWTASEIESLVRDGVTAP